jgi:polyisoprenoid-binding protein YceI
MKRLTKRVLPGILLYCSAASLAFVHTKSNSTKTVTIRIEESSRLAIDGSSNVTSFKCICKETFPERKASMVLDPESDKAEFLRTSLMLTTRKLDCGKKPINQDMYNTLRADEFPQIRIDLEEVSRLASLQIEEGKGAMNMQARTTITIAGVGRAVMLDVAAQKTGEQRFRFRSSKKLKMTDFGLTPPQPLFGMIKVHNEITIHLDLAVAVKE